jgi:hypothetical protein
MMMSIKDSNAVTVIGLGFFLMVLAVPYVTSAAETSLEKQMREAGEAKRAQEQKEAMRDQSHDNRYKTDKNTSVGGDIKGGTPTIDVKKTTK